MKNNLNMKIHNTLNYREWRKSVIKRDSKMCVECGIGGDGVQVHHKISFKEIIMRNNIMCLKDAINCEELWDINNGECMCSCCHIELHIKNKQLNKKPRKP